jgi:hypothetical protein
MHHYASCIYIHTCPRAWIFQLKHVHALGFPVSSRIHWHVFFRKTSTLPSGAANWAFHHVLRCDISIAHRCDGVTSLGPGSTDVMQLQPLLGAHSSFIKAHTHIRIYTNRFKHIHTNELEKTFTCVKICVSILSVYKHVFWEWGGGTIVCCPCLIFSSLERTCQCWPTLSKIDTEKWYLTRQHSRRRQHRYLQAICSFCHPTYLVTLG